MKTSIFVTMAKAFVTALMLAGLSACGGGGAGYGDSGSGGQTAAYVSWSNSTNGTVVMDGANQQFQVRTSDGVVVASGNIPLGGTAVNGNKLSVNGTQTGTVGSATSNAGSNIAVFRCNDGSVMTFSVSTTQYSWSCASAASGSGGTVGGSSSNTGSSASTGTGGGSSTGSGGTTGFNNNGQSALSCLTQGQTSYGAMTLTNGCKFRVTFSYCTYYPDSDGSTLFQCKAQSESNSPTGYIYDKATDSVAPGGTQILPLTSGTNQLVEVAACTSPANPFIIAISATKNTSICNL